MKLSELQQILGQRIRLAVDSKLSAEDRARENDASKTIASLAKQMINNADIILRSDRLLADGKATQTKIDKLI